RLRAGFDAIMVGSRTALVDDPLLTVRGDIVPRVPPVRIVLDTEARLPLASRLAATAAETPTWVVCAEDAPPERRSALEAAGVRVLSAPRGPGGLALDAVLSALWEAGIRSVLCEGGGTLGSALLAEDRVARLYLFFAPKLYGPDRPPAPTPGGGPTSGSSGRMCCWCWTGRGDASAGPRPRKPRRPTQRRPVLDPSRP